MSEREIDQELVVRVQQGDATSTIDAQPHADAERAETLATR